MEFYLYLKLNDSSGTAGQFLVADPPKLRDLEGSWECALVEVLLKCDFTPKSDRLYLYGDFLEETVVNHDRIQVLRNTEVRGKYTKYLSDRIYVPVIPGFKSYIRFTMVDEELKQVDFTSNKLCIVLNFIRK